MILMYHCVATPPADPGGPSVAPAAFRAQMAYLRREYHPMPLEDLARAVAAGTIPERAVAVTVDDGYLDALEVASPILVEYEIPATFFITTRHVDDEGEFWWDTLGRILLTGDDLPPVIDVVVNGARWRSATATPTDRDAARTAIAQRLIRTSAGERDRVVQRLTEWAGVKSLPRPGHRPMLRHEIATLGARPGHTIGAHGVDHLFLPSQPHRIQVQEIEASKACLEEILGRPVLAFSYPHGGCDAETIKVVRDAGFACAVTTTIEPIERVTDVMRLPRHEIDGRDPARFSVLFGGPASS